MRRRLICGFAFVLLLLGSTTAAAVTPECAALDDPAVIAAIQPPREHNLLNALEQQGCLGGSHDDGELSRAIAAILVTTGSGTVPGVSDGERRQATLTALDRLREAAAAQRATISGADSFGIGTRLLRLETLLGEAQRAIGAGRQDEALHRPGYWHYDPNHGHICNSGDGSLCIGIALFDGFIDSACPVPPPAPECQEVFGAARQILRLVRLTERSLSYHARPIIDAHYADAQRRDRQWDAYFDEALFQYPWELMINGVWLQRHDERPRDEHGNRLGFLAAPTSQWILFHPNVAMEYVSSAADGQQLKPALYVELFGYNHWRWSEPGTMRNALGWSLLASYADRAAADDWRYGVMLHYGNRFDIGITYDSESKGGVLVSMDFAQALADINTTARKGIRFLSE